LLHNAAAKEHKVSVASPDPNSAVRIRRNTAARNLVGRELFLHFKVANTYESSRWACALGPNISIGILDQSNYQPERLIARFRQTAKAPILKDGESVIHSYPEAPAAVF
jgi:hypothetical protein